MDKCYQIKMPDGKTFKVLAGKKPDEKTVMALLELFKAALQHLKGQI